MKLKLVFGAAITALLLEGCMPGMGADTALMNKTRGSKNAQISKAQARQYARQQRIAADEMRLQTMKRKQTKGGIEDGASMLNTSIGAIQSVRSLFGK